jgi:hypothetical protein
MQMGFALLLAPVQNNAGTSLQTLENTTDGMQVLAPFAFRSFGQSQTLLFFGLGLVGLDEQMRIVHELLSDFGVGFCVMLPNHVQIPCGQRLFNQGVGQADGMVPVGACQGRQDPAGRPCGEMALAQRIQDFFGQVIDQGQTSTDPAGIASQPPGHLRHAPFEPARQIPDQKTLLHGFPLALLAFAQDHGQHVGFAFLPNVGAQDVHPEHSDGLQTQIAVNEHETRFLFGHQHGGYLPEPAHGGDHRVQFPGPGHTRMRVPGDDLEAFDVFGGHAGGHSRTDASMPITSTFASPCVNHPQPAETTSILANITSIFARSPWMGMILYVPDSKELWGPKTSIFAIRDLASRSRCFSRLRRTYSGCS